MTFRPNHRAVITAATAFILTALAPLAALAQTTPAALVEMINKGEAFAIMRHAIAPGTGDPSNFDVTDCATQRNLDETGRKQARTIGERLKALGLKKAAVFSSAWCRCKETARLLDLGEVKVLPALNSFFGNYQRRAPQTKALRAWLTTERPASPLMLVTHQVNINALTGRYTSSGEIIVARVESDGAVKAIGAIAPR